MKRKATTAILIIVILIGLGLLLYPTVSNYLKTIASHNAISGFTNAVAAIDEDTYEGIMEEAIAYNKKVVSWGTVRTELGEAELAEYERQLSIDGSDVMGYVVIPKIEASLPIYHGTSEDVLQSGIGHLEGSSLPIGGDGTHSVLSGHRGLPSAKLFTNIDRLVVGDTFTVRVLKTVLTYEVDDIQTVLPWEVGSLKIEQDKDYCTLLTCTPYGVNSHRLLVRGHRIPTPPEEEDPEVFDRIIAKQHRSYYLPLIAVCVGIVLLLVAIIVVLIVKRRKKHRRPA